MKQVTAKMINETTMEVTYRGESRQFNAYKCGDRFCARNVFSGKFRTGSKLWPMEVLLWDSGNVTICSGGFSNKGGATGLVGWFNANSQYNTQHNGAR